MSQGEKAAEQTKGFFKDANHAAESIRQNINSFADEIVGSKTGPRSSNVDATTPRNTDQPTLMTGTSAGTAGTSGHHPNAHENTAPGTLGFSDTSAGTHVGTHNTGVTGGGTTTGAHTASGIHPDAERMASGIAAAVDHAGKKLEQKRNEN